MTSDRLSVISYQHFSFHLMNWIFDHFQIVALIALALASWMKRRMDVKRAAQEQGQPPAEMADGEDVLGPGGGWQIPQRQPQPAVPPPLVRQGPPPLVRQSPSLPVELYDNAAILKQQQDLQERLRQIRETKATTGGTARATTTGGAAATRTRVSAAQSHAKSVTPAKAGLRGSLRKRQEIRRAIVMREIIGPPLGLR